jgi:hypothetical protein
MYASQHEILALFIIALPIAAISWTVTHEDLFKEFHASCTEKSKSCHRLFQRKFFYLFTCEFCFSHYVTVFFLIITRYKLLFPDWRGYLISGFSLVWIANVYIALFALIRLDLRKERIEINSEENPGLQKTKTPPREIHRV